MCMECFVYKGQNIEFCMLVMYVHVYNVLPYNVHFRDGFY